MKKGENKEIEGKILTYLEINLIKYPLEKFYERGFLKRFIEGVG